MVGSRAGWCDNYLINTVCLTCMVALSAESTSKGQEQIDLYNSAEHYVQKIARLDRRQNCALAVQALSSAVLLESTPPRAPPCKLSTLYLLNSYHTTPRALQPRDRRIIPSHAHTKPGPSRRPQALWLGGAQSSSTRRLPLKVATCRPSTEVYAIHSSPSSRLKIN